MDRRLHGRLRGLNGSPDAFGAGCAWLRACICCASETSLPTAQRADGSLMRNPLRSEGDMFRLLLYVIAVFGTIIAIIVIVRALR